MNFYLWTESSVAYSWIVNTDKVFSVFLQNRVKEILILINFNEIREKFEALPTKHNVIIAIGSIYDPLRLLNPIFFKSSVQQNMTGMT